MKLITTLFLFISMTTLFSAEIPISFELLLGKLKKIETKNFIKKIESTKKVFENFFENRSRICQGDFSTMVLGEEPKQEVEGEPKKAAKLSRKEIKACLNNLANERMVYIDALYVQRENYLKHLHIKQLEQLKKSKKLESAKWQKVKTGK